MGVVGQPRHVVLDECKRDGLCYQYASEEHRGDIEIALAAFSKEGSMLQYAPPKIRHNKALVSAACQADGLALEYASKRLRGDKKIVLLACQNSRHESIFGFAFQFASDELKSDRDFVLKVCQAGGWEALETCLLAFTTDEEIVLTACKANGKALQYCPDELRTDRQFVLKACKVGGGAALEFVPDKFRADKEIVIAAVTSTPESLKYALGGLNQDKDCLIAANLWDKDHVTSTDKALKDEAKRKIVLSTKFSLSAESSSHATRFTVELKKDPFIAKGNFIVYSPNAFNKTTCDPNWTDSDWPCRGTYETCKFEPFLKVGMPSDECCWRYSFRYHLEEARRSNGFMLQVADYEENPYESMGAATDLNDDYLYDLNDDDLYANHTLGKGQEIETEMAASVGTKVFRFFEPIPYYKDEQASKDRYSMDVNNFVRRIKKWYDSGCKDMTEDNSLDVSKSDDEDSSKDGSNAPSLCGENDGEDSDNLATIDEVQELNAYSSAAQRGEEGQYMVTAELAKEQQDLEEVITDTLWRNTVQAEYVSVEESTNAAPSVGDGQTARKGLGRFFKKWGKKKKK